MCGKNSYCDEDDPEVCAECYVKYIRERYKVPNKVPKEVS